MTSSVRSSLCIFNRVTALVLIEMTTNMAPFTQSYPGRITQRSQNKTSRSNQIQKISLQEYYSGIKLICMRYLDACSDVTKTNKKIEQNMFFDHCLSWNNKDIRKQLHTGPNKILIAVSNI